MRLRSLLRDSDAKLKLIEEHDSSSPGRLRRKIELCGSLHQAETRELMQR
jgi:hypothetical protein